MENDYICVAKKKQKRWYLDQKKVNLKHKIKFLNQVFINTTSSFFTKYFANTKQLTQKFGHSACKIYTKKMQFCGLGSRGAKCGNYGDWFFFSNVLMCLLNKKIFCSKKYNKALKKKRLNVIRPYISFLANDFKVLEKKSFYELFLFSF